MARIDVNGLSIGYEIIGNGSKTAIITPGGRFPKETPGVRDLAENLAKHDYKTVIWDRPNCGESASMAKRSLFSTPTLWPGCSGSWTWRRLW